MMRFLSLSDRWLFRKNRRLCSGALLLFMTIGLTGCVQVGAPSFTLLGSFIPYWMVCATIGLFVTVFARVMFIRWGIDDVLPMRLLVYLCLMLTVSFLLSLLFFVG